MSTGRVRGEIARPGEELFLNCFPFPFLLTSLITLNCDSKRCLGSLISTTLDLLGRPVCSECLGQKPLEIAAQISTALASVQSQQVHIPWTHSNIICVLVTRGGKTYIR